MQFNGRYEKPAENRPRRDEHAVVTRKCQFVRRYTPLSLVLNVFITAGVCTAFKKEKNAPGAVAARYIVFAATNK